HAELQEQTAFVVMQLTDLNEIPWGSDAVGDRQQAERTYQAALDALSEAEGDYRRFPPIVDMLVGLPRDLALSGAAAVILRLAYLQGGLYVPQGVRAALTYTSAAVKPIQCRWTPGLCVYALLRASTTVDIVSSPTMPCRRYGG